VSWRANAAWHIAWARVPQSCMIDPPMELGTLTVMQPSRERS